MGFLNPALNNLTKHLRRKKDQLVTDCDFFNISCTTYPKSRKSLKGEATRFSILYLKKTYITTCLPQDDNFLDLLSH